MTTAWTTAADLRAQVQRCWDKGELLAELATPTDLFPLRLSLRAPASSDLSERFDEVRAWAAGLHQSAGCRLVMREVRHRVIGQNSLPGEAWVDTLDDALRLVGKARDARVYRALLAVTLQRQPALLPWLQRQPLRALALAEVWPQLLDVVAWLQAHPRPGIYLRQVDLPGIHSKFIEAQRGVLCELLDLALPADAIDTMASGAAQFARRYGFRDKPPRVRLRFLDPNHAAWVPGTDADYTVIAAGVCQAGASCEACLHHRERDQLPGLPAGSPAAWWFSVPATASTHWLRPPGCSSADAALLGRHRHPRFRHPRPIARAHPARAVVLDGPRHLGRAPGTVDD